MANYSNALGWFGSPTGAAVTNAIGSGLSAYGQAHEGDANRRTYAANQAQQDYWANQNEQTQRAGGVLNANPLGADQKYAQRNALMDAILSNVHRSSPGDGGVASAMGAGSGFLQTMQGLDPNMIHSKFGPDATMASITQRHKDLSTLDPRSAQADLGSMYGEQAAAPYVQQMQQWAQAAQNANAQERAAYDAKIAALINDQASKNPGSGFWHKLAQVAGIAGGIAAMAIPGLQPLGMIALGAGSGALGAWGAGSNPLMGAVIGGGAAAVPAMRGASGVRGAVNDTASNIYRNAGRLN